MAVSPTFLRDKHLDLWDVKPRPPPKTARVEPKYTEPYIDYSDSQVPPSDNAVYVDLSACDAQAGPEYPEDLSV